MFNMFENFNTTANKFIPNSPVCLKEGNELKCGKTKQDLSSYTNGEIIYYVKTNGKPTYTTHQKLGDACLKVCNGNPNCAGFESTFSNKSCTYYKKASESTKAPESTKAQEAPDSTQQPDLDSPPPEPE